MQYYFAPMEGLTDSIYRRLHHQFFPGADRYYTPFFSPTVHRALTPREARELPPAESLAMTVIPQLLTKNAEDFLWMSQVCGQLGYPEVNLNLGCPSGTVTAKGKGAGMLREPEGLDRFLYEVFSRATVPVSIKTRLGFDDPEEFYALLEIFNRYPIAQLTVHPRVRRVFYNGPVELSFFEYAQRESRAPLCYNGNLCTKRQIDDFCAEHPQVEAVMLGRGLIGDPGMLTPGGTTRQALDAFLDALFAQYSDAFGSSRNAMFRLKENWRHLFCLFDADPKLEKQLRKATQVSQYKAITHEIIHNAPMRPELSPDW